MDDELQECGSRNTASGSVDRAGLVLVAYTVLRVSAQYLSHTKVVLPFVFLSLGGSVLLAGILSPVYQVAKLVGNAFVVPQMARTKNKSYVLTFGCLVGVLGGASVLAASTLIGDPGSFLTITFVLGAALLGVSVGIDDVATNSIMGDIWPRSRRGALIGLVQILVGLATIIVAIGSAHIMNTTDPLSSHLRLLWGSVFTIILALAATFILRVVAKERLVPSSPNQPLQASPRLSDRIRRSFASVASQRWYRRFMWVRLAMLAVSSGMVFYGLHAAILFSNETGSLALFAVAIALGNAVGGLICRKLLPDGTVVNLVLAGSLGAVTAALALTVEYIPALQLAWFYGVIFFILAVGDAFAYSGSTSYYLAAVEPTDREAGYVVLRFVLQPATILLTVLLAYLAHFQTVLIPIGLLAIVSFAGGLAALTLPRIENLDRSLSSSV